MLKRYEFHYPLTKGEVKTRLETAILERNAGIEAEFSDERVKVYQEGGFLYNSFNPVFVGRLRERAGGTVLTGHFRFHAFIVLFVAALIGSTLYKLVQVLGMPEHLPGQADGWRSERLVFELEFLAFAVLIPIAGWLIGTRTRKLLLSVISKSASEH